SRPRREGLGRRLDRVQSVLDARRRTFGAEIARQRVPELERPTPVGVPPQVVNYQLRLHPGLSVTIDLLLAEVMIQACLHDDGMPARFVQTLAHQRADG